MKILELPFRERPVRELLHLDEDRDAPDVEYAGFGWARVDEIWLDEQCVRDVLVLALHASDVGTPLADDIVLGFELAATQSVTALASAFLDKWLPALPRTDVVVLALCNPHRAELRKPAAAPTLYYADGNVDSWIDYGVGEERIRLASEHGWLRRDA